MQNYNWSLVIGLIGILSTNALASEVRGNISLNTEIEIYKTLYDSSSTRNFKFQDTPSPLKSVCEEICLDSQLADLASADGYTSQPEIIDVLKIRTTHEIVNTWLHNEIGEPTSATIAGYYKQHTQDFSRPSQVIFHHLFLMVPPDSNQETESKYHKAKQLADKAKTTNDLETLIVRNSELESAKEDQGKVGPVELQKLNPAIRTALTSLSLGEISEPVRSPYGWEILRLDNMTSESQISLTDVTDQIKEKLFAQRVDQFKETASKKLSINYPVHVNDATLNTTGTDLSVTLFSINDQQITLAQTSHTVQAMNAFQDEPDVRERIRRFLPQFILTEQIKLSAHDQGLLDTSDFKTKERFIKNRVLAEAYIKDYITSRTPTENEIRNAYNAEKQIYTGPPFAKGILYRWTLPDSDTESTSTGAQQYLQTMFIDSITSLVTQVEQGTITTQPLASKADEVQILNWFREGPMGYHHDMAWFKTNAGNFTKPYIVKDSVYLGFVEGRKEREQLPLDKVRTQVRNRLINQWSMDAKKRLIQELLKNCTACQ